jgi:septal ring-binding cell division protein DamX
VVEEPAVVEEPVVAKAPPAVEKPVSPKKLKPRPKKIYAVQVGAFSSLENADALVIKLKKKGYPSYARLSTSRNNKTFFTVVVGRYKDREKAADMVQAFKVFEKMDSFITVVK